MTLPFSKIRKFVLLAALLILAGGGGYTLGERGVAVTVTPDKQVIINQEPPEAIEIDFSLFWDVWQRLFSYYIDRASLNTQTMVWGAISGMVASAGDPYTVFLPPKENEEFKADLGGEFEGIGAQLGLKENRIIVIAPLKGTPAERAGIRPSDWILKVNDEETVGWTVAERRFVGSGGHRLPYIFSMSQTLSLWILRSGVIRFWFPQSSPGSSRLAKLRKLAPYPRRETSKIGQTK